MSQHPIYLSDAVYQLLVKQAAQESRPLEQVAERLLAQELSLADWLDKGQEETLVPDVEEALAAVHRLTTLFADVEFSGLAQALNDPLLELANIDLDVALL